ncbi:hypothetical protein [Streptomyces sp. GC420]|uniref:hypothetical protein n=1 Tax=Streptomyces sp. GC420 TaxID=2697568 RepID=UPI0028BECF45|nr:hypothetical protein [Streptomyces sp. GC420]
MRRQLGLGRLLPLGGPSDGAWIAESAARAVLRDAARAVPGTRLGALRLSLPPGATVSAPVVNAPPSGLPPAPLLLTADFAATAERPLPTAAAGLRAVLAEAADTRLGLVLDAVDLRVSGLLDVGEGGGAGPDATAGSVGAGYGETPAGGSRSAARSSDGKPVAAGGLPGTEALGDGPGTGTAGAGPVGGASGAAPATGGEGGGGAADGTEPAAQARAAAAAQAVPGVAGLTGMLRGPGRSVLVEERPAPGGPALPATHIQVELAVRAGHRALDVALAVRRAVAASLSGRPESPVSVAVVVTSVEGVGE